MEEFKTILKDATFDKILGQGSVKEQLKSTLISERHVILVGPPGVGKTTLVKNILDILPPIEDKTKEERFVRVQGSPDLTAEDLLGDIDPTLALKHGPLSLEAFTPGKIFKADQGILFFDEVNRCSEKLQNALLQVLEERKATIGSYDVDFDAHFILIATMNPDDNSTEPLSDVFLDRFDIITMGYPETQELEEKIVVDNGKRIVDVPHEILQYMVQFVRGLREDDRLEKVPSVRASLGLYERAQSAAYLAGKDSVTFEDLGKVVESVIAHRIRLKPSVQFVTTPEKFVKTMYDKLLDENNLVGGGR